MSDEIESVRLDADDQFLNTTGIQGIKTLSVRITELPVTANEPVFQAKVISVPNHSLLNAGAGPEFQLSGYVIKNIGSKLDMPQQVVNQPEPVHPIEIPDSEEKKVPETESITKIKATAENDNHYPENNITAPELSSVKKGAPEFQLKNTEITAAAQEESEWLPPDLNTGPLPTPQIADETLSPAFKKHVEANLPVQKEQKGLKAYWVKGSNITVATVSALYRSLRKGISEEYKKIKSRE